MLIWNTVWERDDCSLSWVAAMFRLISPWDINFNTSWAVCTVFTERFFIWMPWESDSRISKFLF